MYGEAYTPEMVAWLKVREHIPRRQLTEMFNLHFQTSRTVSAIKGFCSRSGMKTGRTGCFQKGIVPFNAGTKGVMSSNRTSFKKGNKPHNWRPIGFERVSRDGYLQRKVTDTGCTKDDFVEVHRLVWEENNGPIPAGHIVIFIDGDKMNVEPENLELVSRAVHATRCKYDYYSYPRELRPQLEAMIALRKAIRAARKSKNKA